MVVHHHLNSALHVVDGQPHDVAHSEELWVLINDLSDSLTCDDPRPDFLQEKDPEQAHEARGKPQCFSSTLRTQKCQEVIADVH